MIMTIKNSKKLYPASLNPTLPADLKTWLSDVAGDKTENALMREWIEELHEGKIDLALLKKMSY